MQNAPCPTGMSVALGISVYTSLVIEKMLVSYGQVE